MTGRGPLRVIVRWATAVLAVAILAAIVWFAPPLLQSHAGCQPPFGVATGNIGIERQGSTRPKNLEEVARWVKSVGRPELFLLQEVQGLVRGEELAAKSGYEYFVDGRTLHPQTSQVILSDFPVLDAYRVSLHPNSPAVAAVCAILDVSSSRMSHAVLVCSVHLGSASPALEIDGEGGYRLGSLMDLVAREVFSDETSRMDSVNRLIGWMDGVNRDAAILGGDFNTIPIAMPIRVLSRGLDDSLTHRPHYFKGTKESELRLPVNPRIDYLFHTDNLAVLDSSILDISLGDHRPVTAHLALCESGER